jgi:hypothetical protein
MQAAPVRPATRRAAAVSAVRRATVRAALLRPVAGPGAMRTDGDRTFFVPAAARPLRPALPSVTEALRAMESLLLSGGQRTARRNAWTAVLEDRRRAADRAEAQSVLEGVADRTPRAT